MRKGTTIALAFLLLLILGATTLQLFFLADRDGTDQRPTRPTTVTSTTLG